MVTSSSSRTTITKAPAFTAPPGCNSNHLSLLHTSGERVWLNAPYPASGLTSSSCYPSDLLKSLKSPFSGSPTSSLSCPNWYTTISRYESNYVVCCPSSYSLALNPSAALTNRPANGATCYFDLSTRTTVTSFDNVTIIATQPYLDPTAQAFALVIDGFTGTHSSATSTSGSSSSSSSSSASASLRPGSSPFSANPTSQPTIHKHKSHLKGGAIAGIVIGVLIGIALILVAILALLRRVKNRRAATAGLAEAPGDNGSPYNGEYYADKPLPHSPGSQAPPYVAYKTALPPAELSSDQRIHEMGTEGTKGEFPEMASGESLAEAWTPHTPVSPMPDRRPADGPTRAELSS